MWFEVIFSSAVFLALFIYHVYLVYKLRRDPLTTAIGITNNVRYMWVKGVIRDKRDILAVQTLRNQVMAATFLASTAFLSVLGSSGPLFDRVYSARSLMRSICLGQKPKHCGCSN